MIAGWLAYCVIVGTLVCLAGSLLDQRLTSAQRPARWVWTAAIAATLAIPTITFARQYRTPATLPFAVDIGPRAYTDRLVALFGVASVDSTPAPRDIARPRVPEIASLDRPAFVVAILVMLVAFARVIVDSVLLHRGRTRWAPSRVDARDVLVSREFGPAIVGLLRYAIVLPEWALALPPAERALVFAHEDEHARANDVRVTTAALLAVLCMSWNPALWYAMRRLRHAIEVDCDRRVLRAGGDVETYGRLLVDMAGRATGRSFAVAGFSERAAPVVRRIRAMTTRPGRLSVLRFAGSGLLAAAVVGGAVFLLPPPPPAMAIPLPGAPAPFLAQNAADSIAEGDSARIVGRALGLPERFSVVETESRLDALVPAVAQCALRLRDDRDGTLLLNRQSHMRTRGVTQRNDTAWTRIERVAFFTPMQPNRYGLRDGQRLRVGCGGYTRIRVNGRDVELVAPASLTTELRAKRAAFIDRLRRQVLIAPEAVELRAHYVRVVLADSGLVASPSDSAWHTLMRIKDAAIAALGAQPDTLAFTYHDNGARALTLYTYPNHRP